VTSLFATAPATSDRDEPVARPSANRVFLGSALAGCCGMLLIALGALQPHSPFTSDVRGSWPLQLTSAPLGGTWVGLLLVYSGIVLLLGAWYCVGVSGRQRPLRHLAVVFAAWVAPLLVVPPLFSRDVYAYAALGQLTARGVNPYSHSPASDPRSSLLPFVDPLWRHAHAPYGPLFMDVGRAIASLAGNSVFVAVEGYRLVALAGVVLVAASVPVIARSVGCRPATAFALAVLNPLVLLGLVGGAHNDAVMLGLLVAGIALSLRRHAVTGIVLCALAAEVKIPGLIGVVFIGWAWPGPGSPRGRRLQRVSLALLIAAVVMVAVSEVSGLGWGWLSNLSDPGTVVSWLDPATALGLTTWHALQLVGIGGPVHPVVVAWRGIALAVAGLVTVTMLVRSDRYGLPKSLAVSLLAIVFLGPIVWPWYETWGLVFLAFVPRPWARRLLLLLTAVGCFATIPSGVNLTWDQTVVVTVIVGTLAAASLLSVLGARRYLRKAGAPP
jgi:alpha-1,6-mannosyltransferase